MIDLDQLEALAKAAQTGAPGHRIKFFVQIDPETILTLIAETRALREDLQAAKLLAHANGEMFRAEKADNEALRENIISACIVAVANLSGEEYSPIWNSAISEAVDRLNAMKEPK